MKIAELIITLVVIVLALVVAWAFITPLIFAAILAYFSYPLYLKMKKRFGINGSAVIICAVFVALLILTLNYGVTFALNEVWNIYLNLAGKAEVMSNTTQEMLRFIATNTINTLSNQLKQIPNIVISSFIFFVSLFYFLRDGERVTNWVEEALPMQYRKKMQVFNNIKQNVDAFVHTTLLIGFLQAVVAGIGFTIFGLGYPFLAGVIAGLLSLLPVIGPYLLYIPVAIYLFIQGDTSLAIGIALYGSIIGSLLDYAARPFLMGRKARLHPMIIFIGVFGGMSLMGLAGIIIGPIILSIATAFFRDLGVKND